MARLGVTIGVTAIGAGVGAYFGNPQLGAQIGYVAGSVLSAALFPPAGAEGPRLGDLRVGDASPGVPIPIPYGTAQIAGNMIWTAGIEERRIEESAKGGPTNTTYQYFASFAIGLCEGPIESVRKLWLDTKLVYDVSSDNLGIVTKRLGEIDPRGILDADELEDRRASIEAELASVKSALIIYLGTEAQLPDPLIEVYEGLGTTPAHRGLAYLVFEDLPLLPYGNRIPQVRAEVLKEASPAYPRRTVTPPFTPIGLQRDNFLFDPARQHLWIRSASRIIQIDALNNTLLQDKLVDTTVETGGTLYWNALAHGTAIDVDGALYVPVSGPTSSIQRLARLDPVSLKVTHVGINASTGLPANLGALVTLQCSQNYVWWAGFVTNSLYCFFRPGSFRPDGVRRDEMENISSYPLAGGLASVRGYQIAIDRDEQAWFLCSSGVPAFNGTTYLVLMDPQGAVQTFDITSDIKAARWMAYDALTHSLVIKGYVDIVSFQARIIRWDVATHAVVDQVDNLPLGTYAASAFQHGIVGRTLWTGNGPNFFAFDVDTFTLRETVSVTGTYGGNFHYGVIYDDTTHALWAMEDSVQLGKYFLDRDAVGTTTLATIVADISTRAGLTPASDLVTTALTDTVYGYVLSRRAEARASLEPLLAAYLVDAVESDWKIRYSHRGGLTPVVTLTANNLGAGAPSETVQDAVTIERLPDLVLPVRLDVQYTDPARDYQDNTQHARRQQASLLAQGQLTAQTPVLMDALTAKQLAEQSLWESWSQRQRYQLRLPYRWGTLDPGDVVTVTDPATSRTHLIRLTSVQHGANGVMECQGVAYDRSIYTVSDAEGTETDFAPQMLLPTALTLLFLLDIPLVRDTDNDAGFYLGAAPGGLGEWPGAVVFQSPDIDGWEEFTTLTSQTVWGAAVTALADGSPYVFDRESTVDVRFVNGTPTSSTELGVLNGANALLLGTEILQFVTVASLGSQTYRLSTLLRGRRGTEGETAIHTVGEHAILLTLDGLRRGDMLASELDRSLLYRGVTFENDLLASRIEPFTNTGNGLRPYAPDHVRGTRDGSNNLTITWIRRTRIGGEWVDARDVPLAEDSESYEVDIMSGSTVLRTLTSSTQAVSYTAAQQTTDGLTPGDPVSCRVYQLSALVGRGFRRAATV